MGAALLVPLLLPQLSEKPQGSFLHPYHVSVYARNGWLKGVSSDGKERDLVLQRPLEGLNLYPDTPPELSIANGDSLIVALSKLQNLLTRISDRKISSDNITFASPLDLRGQRITNVGDPVEDQDVVTKKYYHENSPRELVNTIIAFTVGQIGFPASLDTQYTNADLIGKQIKVFREGERMDLGDTGLGFNFDETSGTVTFYPELHEGESIILEATLAADVDLSGIYSRLAVIEAGGVGGSPVEISEIKAQLSAFESAMNARFDALEQIIDQGPLVINSFGTTAPLMELGATLTDVTLNWSLSRSPTSLSISPTIGSIASNLRTITSRLNLTSTTDFTLTVIAGSRVLNASTRVNFGNRMYYGSSAKTALSNAEILALASNPLATGRARNVSINGNGNYLFIAYPKAWGEPTFMISGMLNNAWTKTEIQLTNALNYTTTYNVYRSNTIQNGSAIAISIS